MDNLEYIIIACFIIVFGYGFVLILGRLRSNNKMHSFAMEFRNRFVAFSNSYIKTKDSWSNSGDIDQTEYIWLTKNVNRIQSDMGYLGRMLYIGPMQRFKIPNYEILINTIPKFRDGNIQNFDINSSDDCLIRYIGELELISEKHSKNLKNPIIWFKDGLHEIISVPILLFNWFGLLSNRTVSKIKNNLIYKGLTGLAALVTFISGIVTIIQGKDKTLEFLMIIHTYFN